MQGQLQRVNMKKKFLPLIEYVSEAIVTGICAGLFSYVIGSAMGYVRTTKTAAE
jgi:hypothetical protein